MNRMGKIVLGAGLVILGTLVAVFAYLTKEAPAPTPEGDAASDTGQVITPDPEPGANGDV